MGDLVKFTLCRTIKMDMSCCNRELKLVGELHATYG